MEEESKSFFGTFLTSFVRMLSNEIENVDAIFNKLDNLGSALPSSYAPTNDLLIPIFFENLS